MELENPSIQDAPLSMIETLQAAAYQQMQEQVSQQAEDPAAPSTQLPDAQEQALDEYPMPTRRWPRTIWRNAAIWTEICFPSPKNEPMS